MQEYIGTKVVRAKPMNRQEYNDLRGWVLSEDENGSDEGYLVEYVDGGQANHKDFAGYISWSPKDVFERAYFKTEGMSFGQAIEAAKLGKKIARKKWNGKNMFVVFMPALYLEPEQVNERTRKHIGEGKPLDVQPYFSMYNAQEQWICGWLASQSDMLDTDWFVVE